MNVVNTLIKWLIQQAVALSAGLLVIIFLSPTPQISPFLLRIIILVAIAVMSAFSARVFFTRVTPIFSILTSLVSSLLSVLIIDHFYRSAYRMTFIDNQFKLDVPTVRDISQIVFLFLATLPVALLFRRPKSHRSQYRKPLINFNKISRTISMRFNNILQVINPANWQILKKLKLQKKVSIKTPTYKTAAPKISMTSPTRIKSEKKLAPVQVNKPASRTKPQKMKSSKKIFSSRNHDVKLVGEEEHVCPYCLEEVHKNDKRGVKICQECGTWHHQDCWDLTGSCGVAHRNEL